MNFYYFMHLACPVQENLTPMQFIERLGLPFALQRGDRIHGVDPENPTPDDQERPIKMRLDGTERTLARRELRDLYNEFLSTGRLHCLHCPLNKTPEPFACVGALKLPLSAHGEKWLFDQFTPPAPEHSYVAEHIRLSRLPGRRHELLLAGSVEYQCQLGADQPSLTSTLLFYYLLNMRDIQYESRLRLLYEFGAIKARPRDIEELTALLAEAQVGEGRLAPSELNERIRRVIGRFKIRMKYDRSDDESVAALKQYFFFNLQSLGAGIPMYASLM